MALVCNEPQLLLRCRFIYQHQQEIGPLMEATVEQLDLGTRHVVSVPSDMPTINAFAAMYSSGVSSAGIIDLHGGCLALVHAA